MIEISANIFDSDCDWICITTNGFVKRDGKCVMGAGVAKQARDKYRDIDSQLGEKILTLGNKVHIIGRYDGRFLLSFPTKHNWWEKSDIELIELSCHQLRELYLNQEDKPKVGVPRPGCSNGKLNWADVKPIVEKVLVEEDFLIYDYYE